MNKLYKLVLAGAVLMVAGIACSQKGEVQTVATNYLTALVEYRFDDAKQFGDESVGRFLDEMQQIIDGQTAAEHEKTRKANAGVLVEIKKIKIDGNKAQVKYIFTKEKQVLQAQTLYLEKKPEGWKVQEFMY